MGSLPDELEQLADVCGVATSFKDVHGKRREASAESVLAVLNALGVDVASLDDAPRALDAQRQARLERGIEPVITCWDGDPTEFTFALPAQHASGSVRCAIELEEQDEPIVQPIDLAQASGEASPCKRFVSFRWQLPRLPDGFHRLRIESAGSLHTAQIISAPRRAFGGDASPGGAWGCFLPLYALRRRRNWGVGDFTDLQEFGRWTSDLGGNIVGTLPLLAAYLDDPCEPSPYAPASRLAWNELYVDVTQVPELAVCPPAAEYVQSSALQDEVAQLQESEHVDYRRVMALKRYVLEMLAETFFEKKPPGRYAEFEHFLERHPHIEDYAEFRATQERRRESWDQWPHPMCDGHLSDSDYDVRNKRYHLYAQWIATGQLERLADAAGGGLYLDLPLGLRADGYDVWRWGDVYVSGASAGSPPDAMWTKGQEWGFPPLHPAKIREEGYRHVRHYLAHHMRLARLLRIDHVMQLHRLYWIPRGMRADQGCYVNYRADEFYAILSLESHRCRTTLVGENLGTVPPEVDRAMERHNLQQMYVVQYEVAEPDNDSSRDNSYAAAGQLASAAAPAGQSNTADDRSRPPESSLNEVPPGALASLNTHDMPTFAAWWRGEDISLRRELDLLTEQEASDARERLKTLRVELTEWLRSEGWLVGGESDDYQVLLAILKFLSVSDAGVVLVSLEDLWLETRPQNVPGTGMEMPNWRRRAAVTFEEFSRHPDVLAALQTVARLRQQRNSRET